MKTLQNNFTTPEQSKKLLELGVSAKSADCFWSNPIGSKMYVSPIVRNKLSYRCKDWFKKNNYFYTPCWSVGRLIEIYETCTSCLFERRFPQLSVLEDVLAQIAEDIIATDECWDFSKLED